MLVAFVVAVFLQGFVAVDAAGKQQDVGHVFAAFAAQIDLRQIVLAPAQCCQHRLNHQLFGLRLIERGVGVLA